MDDLLTSDVARRLQVSPDTVRNYERCGLLTARRTASGVRIFSPVDVERFAEERISQRTHKTRVPR